MEKQYTKLDIIMILIYMTIAILGITTCIALSAQTEHMNLDHRTQTSIMGDVHEWWNGNRDGSGKSGAAIAFGIISATCIYLIHSILYKKSK